MVETAEVTEEIEKSIYNSLKEFTKNSGIKNLRLVLNKEDLLKLTTEIKEKFKGFTIADTETDKEEFKEKFGENFKAIRLSYGCIVYLYEEKK